jgi:hypothetical protein
MIKTVGTLISEYLPDNSSVRHVTDDAGCGASPLTRRSYRRDRKMIEYKIEYIYFHSIDWVMRGVWKQYLRPLRSCPVQEMLG